MGELTNFPDVPTWQKFRAEIEPYLSSNQTPVVADIERIIQNYDDPPLTREQAFEQLIASLSLTEHVDSLTNNIAAALKADQKDRQAKEMLLTWLPNRLVNFTVQRLEFKKIVHQDKEDEYIQTSINIPSRIKNWLFFPTLTEWQDLQERLRPYRENPIDLPLIQLIDKAEENYIYTEKFIFYIEAICEWMLQQKKIKHILTGGGTSDSRKIIALKTDLGRNWIENRLKSWMRINLAEKFKPTGENATGFLVPLVYKNLHHRIYELLPNFYYGNINLEDSSNAVNDYGENYSLFDEYVLQTYSDNSLETLEKRISNLQQADKVRRGFPIFKEFVSALVNNLEAIHQSCWEVRLANYINQDPHQELQNMFYVEPSCHYQYLAQSLVLPKLQGLPAKSVSDVCREFPLMAESGLRSHITRHFYPWIDSIYLEILTEQEWSEYRNHLEHIAVEELTLLHRKSFPTCNILFLAQNRLPCFVASPVDWLTLAQTISKKDSKKFKPEYVEKFWHTECRPKLGRIARQQILEYPMI